MVKLILSDLTVEKDGGPVAPQRLACLAGFDVEGFSRVVNREVELAGRSAGEVAASALFRGGAVVRKILEAAAFEPFESIGDGTLFVRYGESLSKREAVEIEGLLKAARQAHLAHAGLRIRTAWTFGQIAAWPLDGRVGRQKAFLWGEALADIHARLAAAPRHKNLPSRDLLRDGQAWIDDANGKIGEEHCLYLRFYRAEEWRLFDMAACRGALLQISQWCGALDGKIERLAHDDKGIHVRCSFGTANLSANEVEFGAKALVSSLIAEGFSAAASLSTGLVFRGFDGAEWQIHGSAINSAAKNCAKLPTGATEFSGQGHAALVSESPWPQSSEIFGRAGEIAALNSWVEKPGARSVILRGPSGIGKSYLAREQFERIADNSLSAWERCTSQTPLLPFSIARAVIKSLFSALTQKSVSSSAHDVVDAALNHAETPMEWHDEFRGFLLADETAYPLVNPENAAQRAYMLRRFMAHVLAKLSHDEKLVLAIDDAHLVDRESSEVLALALQANGDIVLIVTSRAQADSDPMQAVIDLPSTKEILLLPIDVTALRSLIACCSTSLTHAQVEAVEHIAGGNPFLAIQAAKWIEEGANQADSSAEKIIASRISRLTLLEQLILRIVSVLGVPTRTSHIALIAAQCGMDDDVRTVVSRLCRDGFLRVAHGSRSVFEPGHDLISAAARSEMSDGASILLHRAAAAGLWRGVRQDKKMQEDLPRLASYWLGARAFERSALCYARAGSAALRNGYLQSAVDLFSRAIECAVQGGAGKATRVAEWRSLRAESLWSAGALVRANSASIECLRTAPKRRKNIRWRDARIRASTIRAETGTFTGRASDIFGGSWQLTRASLSSPERSLVQGRSYATLGYMAGIMRAQNLSHRFFGTAKKLGAKMGDSRPEAYVLAAEGLLDYIFCRGDQGNATLARGLLCLKDWKTEYQLTEILVASLGIGANQQGKLDISRRHFEELRMRSSQRGHRMHQCWSAYNLALIDMLEGNLDSAQTQFSVTETLSIGVGDHQSEHICAGIHSRLLWACEDYEGSLIQARRAGEIAAQTWPTNYCSIEGYSAAPLIGALAMLDGGPLYDRGAALVHKYLKPLKTFARIFPLARPRLAIVEALVEATQKRPTLEAMIKHARDSAVSTGMGSELLLADQVFQSL